MATSVGASDAVEKANIEASLKKAESRHALCAVILSLFAICFLVKTCATIPDPSIECTKAGGNFHQYTYDAYGRRIGEYCDKVVK